MNAVLVSQTDFQVDGCFKIHVESKVSFDILASIPMV